MPYPTQHENFYKNRIVQLQQKLQQLTEIYNYRLNEVTDWRTLIRRVPDGDGPGGPGRFLPDGPDGNPRGYGTNNPTIDPEEIARREAAAAAAREAARIAAMAARVTEFAMMTPQEIINFIRDASPELKRYILENWGTVVEVGATTWQSGRTWQRLSPDGTVQVWVPNQSWATNGTWNIINKPGFMTAFGPIGANGVVIPMDVYQGMGHGGHSPADMTYIPGIFPGNYFGTTRPDPRGRIEQIGGDVPW